MRDLNAPSLLERFAVPHQFQPRMSAYGAFVAVAGALARILLGSLIGALWGVGIWLAAVSAHSIAWKGLAIFGLVAGLAVSLALLLLAVHACVAFLERKRPATH
jgi:hypothetical protein